MYQEKHVHNLYSLNPAICCKICCPQPLTCEKNQSHNNLVKWWPILIKLNMDYTLLSFQLLYYSKMQPLASKTPTRREGKTYITPTGGLPQNTESLLRKLNNLTKIHTIIYKRINKLLGKLNKAIKP